MAEPDPAFWLERPSLAALEIAAALGYRAVIIDMEPGIIPPEDCDMLVAQGRSLRLLVIVRVAASERILIQQALDFGADGVMLPMVRDADHAAERFGICEVRAPGLSRRGLRASLRLWSLSVGRPRFSSRGK